MSNIMHHPAYVPTIFPPEYYRQAPADSTASGERFDRWAERHRRSADSSMNAFQSLQPATNANTQPENAEGQDVCSQRHCGVDSHDNAEHEPAVNNRNQEQSVQEVHLHSVNSLGVEKTDLKRLDLTNEQPCQNAPATPAISSSQMCPLVVHRAVGQNTRSCFFGGYDALSHTPGAITALCGVEENVFSLLLSMLPQTRDKGSDVSVPNKLAIFLVKMEHGMPFSAIAVLFSIHETTASRIFHSVLGTLAHAARKWVYKPHLRVIHDTMPECFKLSYPECTLIVDCTEVRTETPSDVRQQHVLYSSYKNGFTLKFLVAIAPSGWIVYKSKSYGGRCSDAHIVLDSNFLDIIEESDVILADKGFLGIRAGVAGKSAVLVMPPFSTGNQPFSREELQQTHHIAQVRIHVERMIQRIKTHGVLQHRIPITLIPAMSSIFHMCCVLANL